MPSFLNPNKAMFGRSIKRMSQIELSKNYGVSEWREDLKNMLLKAGLQNKSIVFLFSDTQVAAAVNLLNLLFIPSHLI